MHVGRQQLSGVKVVPVESDIVESAREIGISCGN